MSRFCVHASGLAVACIVACAATMVAHAQSQSTSSAWGDVWNFKSSDQRAVDLGVATSIYNIQQHAGLAPVTNIYGQENTTTNTYNGTVNQNSALNVNNMSTSSSTVKADNSMVTVTQTGSQSSDTTTQGAASNTFTANGGTH